MAYAAAQVTGGLLGHARRTFHADEMHEYGSVASLSSKPMMCKLMTGTDKRASKNLNNFPVTKLGSEFKGRNCLFAPIMRNDPGCREHSRDFSIKAAVGVLESPRVDENQVAISGSERCSDFASCSRSNLPAKNIDRWLQKFASEIVKNITEAPVIHLLYDTEGTNVRTERQKVWREDLHLLSPWSRIKESFSHRAPDGLILVQRLDCEAARECCVADAISGCVEQDASINRETQNSTDIWGILVLGRSLTRSACYIMKTTRVPCRFGICTSFFLTRAKCFGQPLQQQLESAWLADKDWHAPPPAQRSSKGGS